MGGARAPEQHGGRRWGPLLATETVTVRGVPGGSGERGRGGGEGEDDIPYYVLCTMRHRLAGTCLLDVVPMMLRAQGVVCVCVWRVVAARR